MVLRLAAEWCETVKNNKWIYRPSPFMVPGTGRGPSPKRRIVEGLSAHPYITILIIWTLVYVPILIAVGLSFPEDHTTTELTIDDLRSSGENKLEYFDPDINVMLTARIIGNDTDVTVLAPDGFIPIRMELVGYGKLYTSSPYDENRTWTLGDGEIRYIQQKGNNVSWRVDVYKKVTDAPFYKDRGETLLEGHMIYRDVPTLNPPLINVFWIIPAMVGGSFFVFRSYFALFALFSALLVMRTYWEEGRWKCVLFGGMFLLNPLTIYSTIGAVQDDIIVAFLFAVSVHSIIRRREFLASLTVGLGMATKVFHALMLPGILSDRQPLARRLLRTILSVIVLAVVMIPVTYLSPGGVSTFARLYLTGDSGAELTGISLWRYLGELGYPPFLNTPVLVLLGLGLLFVTFRKEIGMIGTTLLFILLFLMVFPKIHSGYYLLLLPFIPFLWKMGASRFLIPLMGALVLLLDLMNGASWNSGHLLFVPILVCSVLYIITGYLFIRVLGERLKDARINRRSRI
ncbi:hypothetical protein B6U90_02115 [Thermoplasmatales archaeon ex4484_6]|nr:MAG: hypothetical protein B6U90_02115 [Thermoplasmatales archaeon ex4484_6]